MVIRLIVLFVLGFGSLPRLLTAQETFREPKIDGTRVDWCLSWGTDCGQPAANEFCRRPGLQESAEL